MKPPKNRHFLTPSSPQSPHTQDQPQQNPQKMQHLSNFSPPRRPKTTRNALTQTQSNPQLRPKHRPQHHSGVTFIELIGVLVVAIIIIAGAIALYTEANTSSRTNQLLVAIGAISGAMRSLHANTATYGGSFAAPRDTRPVIISSNSVPPGMLIEVKGAIVTLKHSFGGDIIVAGAGQHFFVAATGLQHDICIRLATESTAKSSSGLRGVYVGPTGNSLTANSANVKRIEDAISSNSRGTLDSTTGSIFIPTIQTSAGPTNVPIAPNSADQACGNNNNRMIAWLLQ